MSKFVLHIKLNDVHFGQKVLLANLRLFFHKDVIEHLNEALHGVCKRQLTVGSEKLQVKVSLGYLILLENRRLILRLFFDGFKLFFLFIQEVHIRRHLFQLLLPVNDVLLKELFENLSSEFTPKLRKEVSGRQQLRWVFFVHILIQRSESCYSEGVVVDNLNLKRKDKLGYGPKTYTQVEQNEVHGVLERVLSVELGLLLFFGDLILVSCIRWIRVLVLLTFSCGFLLAEFRPLGHLNHSRKEISQVIWKQS